MDKNNPYLEIAKEYRTLEDVKKNIFFNSTDFSEEFDMSILSYYCNKDIVNESK
jgi:hypothetical protein